MASYDIISILKKLNPENFLNNSYDSEKREFVVYFKHRNIKLPDSCYIAHHHIYDDDEDIKVCRIEIQG